MSDKYQLNIQIDQGSKEGDSALATSVNSPQNNQNAQIVVKGDVSSKIKNNDDFYLIESKKLIKQGEYKKCFTMINRYLDRSKNSEMSTINLMKFCHRLTTSSYKILDKYFRNNEIQNKKLSIPLLKRSSSFLFIWYKCLIALFSSKNIVKVYQYAIPPDLRSSASPRQQYQQQQLSQNFSNQINSLKQQEAQVITQYNLDFNNQVKFYDIDMGQVRQVKICYLEQNVFFEQLVEKSQLKYFPKQLKIIHYLEVFWVNLIHIMMNWSFYYKKSGDASASLKFLCQCDKLIEMKEFQYSQNPQLLALASKVKMHLNLILLELDLHGQAIMVGYQAIDQLQRELERNITIRAEHYKVSKDIEIMDLQNIQTTATFLVQTLINMSYSLEVAERISEYIECLKFAIWVCDNLLSDYQTTDLNIYANNLYQQAVRKYRKLLLEEAEIKIVLNKVCPFDTGQGENEEQVFKDYVDIVNNYMYKKFNYSELNQSQFLVQKEPHEIEKEDVSSTFNFSLYSGLSAWQLQYQQPNYNSKVKQYQRVNNNLEKIVSGVDNNTRQSLVKSQQQSGGKNYIDIKEILSTDGDLTTITTPQAKIGGTASKKTSQQQQPYSISIKKADNFDLSKQETTYSQNKSINNLISPQPGILENENNNNSGQQVITEEESRLEELKKIKSDRVMLQQRIQNTIKNDQMSYRTKKQKQKFLNIDENNNKVYKPKLLTSNKYWTLQDDIDDLSMQPAIESFAARYSSQQILKKSAENIRPATCQNKQKRKTYFLSPNTKINKLEKLEDIDEYQFFKSPLKKRISQAFNNNSQGQIHLQPQMYNSNQSYSLRTTTAVTQKQQEERESDMDMIIRKMLLKKIIRSGKFKKLDEVEQAQQNEDKEDNFDQNQFNYGEKMLYLRKHYGKSPGSVLNSIEKIPDFSLFEAHNYVVSEANVLQGQIQAQSEMERREQRQKEVEKEMMALAKLRETETNTARPIQQVILKHSKTLNIQSYKHSQKMIKQNQCRQGNSKSPKQGSPKTNKETSKERQGDKKEVLRNQNQYKSGIMIRPTTTSQRQTRNSKKNITTNKINANYSDLKAGKTRSPDLRLNKTLGEKLEDQQIHLGNKQKESQKSQAKAEESTSSLIQKEQVMQNVHKMNFKMMKFYLDEVEKNLQEMEEQQQNMGKVDDRTNHKVSRSKRLSNVNQLEEDQLGLARTEDNNENQISKKLADRYTTLARTTMFYLSSQKPVQKMTSFSDLMAHRLKIQRSNNERKTMIKNQQTGHSSLFQKKLSLKINQ